MRGMRTQPEIHKCEVCGANGYGPDCTACLMTAERERKRAERRAAWEAEQARLDAMPALDVPELWDVIRGKRKP
jgi:hypothetical protein